ISGKWVREGGAVVSREGKPARIQAPYRPPEEYDLRMVFARQAANFCVNIILSRGGEAFTLVMHNSGTFGFEKINGDDFHKNASTSNFGSPLQFNRPYVVVVEVRKNGVRAFCEGQEVCDLKSYDGLTMNPDWKLPDPAALGVGTWDG